MNLRKYSSKEFAVKASVTKKTLRHYSKLKLLSPSTIDDNGYWYYNDADLKTMELIQSLKLIGLSLTEIKKNLDSDFNELLPLIDEKIQHIDRQKEDLDTAKRLLTRIKNKKTLKTNDAIKESIEEDHLDWLKENIDDEKLKLINSMEQKATSYDEHIKILELIKDFRVYLATKNNTMMSQAIDEIKRIYKNNGLDDQSIKLLMTFIIKSSLNGPSHSRIINEVESIEFLKRF